MTARGRPSGWLLVVGIGFVLGACEAQPAPPRAPSREPSTWAATAPEREVSAPSPDGAAGGDCRCEVDDDCVKVTPGCCGCAAGGTERAVTETCVDRLVGCDRPAEEIGCGRAYLCTDREARCEAGVCVLR